MQTLIDIHTHKLKTKSAIEILNVEIENMEASQKNISMGIHPWHINNDDLEMKLLIIKNHLINSNIAALGEAGLDRSVSITMDLQKKVFIELVKLSDCFSLPIIIHCVRAWSDILQIRNNLKAKQPWIFHGYNGNIETAKQIINHKCYLSFGKSLLTNKKNQHVFIDIPLDNIFLETDDSEEKIETIYNKAAELKKLSINLLAKNLHENYIQLFNKKI